MVSAAAPPRPAPDDAQDDAPDDASVSAGFAGVAVGSAALLGVVTARLCRKRRTPSTPFIDELRFFDDDFAAVDVKMYVCSVTPNAAPTACWPETPPARERPQQAPRAGPPRPQDCP